MDDRLRAILHPDTTVTPVDTAPGAPPPEEESDVVEEECAVWLKGAREKAVALEFRPRSGDWPAADYALVKHRWWHSDNGGFTAEYVSGLKVVVTGWGLRDYYVQFLRNRLLVVEEKGHDAVRETAARKAGVKGWVHSIEVTLPEEKEK